MRDPGLSKALHIALDLAVILAVIVGPIVLVVLYHVGVQVASFWERVSGLRPRRMTREMGARGRSRLVRFRDYPPGGGQGVNSGSNAVASADGRLKAPFPYFGGKSRVADIVWERLGDVDNYIEPFCGSAAVLLARPTAPRIETVNDADCYVANFWRATGKDPEAVAEHADWPVNEADLHARHRWQVLSDEARAFRERMRADPDYFDARVAGWWCWGLCCWIGSGWCRTNESAEWGQTPLSASGLTGVHSRGDGQSRKMPRLTGGRKGDLYYGGLGVNAEAPIPEKRPILAAPENASGRRSHHGIGVHAKGPSGTNRPQLADAFARGRGIHGNDQAEVCADRREWLIGWFGRLRDRPRTVRVCCGDWRRVCDSHSVTTRLGTTGVFFDPPYSAEADRCNTLYGVESTTVAHDARAYCLERGADPAMRIVLAGYEGEGHEVLESAGWSVVAWKAAGGYGNRSDKGRENAARERLWFSPHCIDPRIERMPLFRSLEP